jgi:hypothetical protein
MSGVAFVLFTNYMITDPGTTPMNPVIVCACRGLGLWAAYLWKQGGERRPSAVAVPTSRPAGQAEVAAL